MLNRTERRAAAHARHVAPPGAMSLATERLIERTPAKYREKYVAAAANGESDPEYWLNRGGAFSEAGRKQPVAYAGGAIIAHLPKSKTKHGGQPHSMFRSAGEAPVRVRTHARMTLAEVHVRVAAQGKASHQAKKELREQVRSKSLADIRVLAKELCEQLQR